MKRIHRRHHAVREPHPVRRCKSEIDTTLPHASMLDIVDKPLDVDHAP